MADAAEIARAAFAGLADVPAVLARVEATNRELLERLERIEARLPLDLVPTEEYQRRTGLSRSSIARAIKSGELPVVRVGRRVLIDAGAVRPVTPETVARLAREARGG
jgi:excisionase family DNA binding protein